MLHVFILGLIGAVWEHSQTIICILSLTNEFHYESSVAFISSLKVRLVSMSSRWPCTAQLPNAGMCATVQGKHCAFTELCFQQTVCFSGGFTTPRGRKHNGGFVCSLESSQNLRILLTSSSKASFLPSTESCSSVSDHSQIPFRKQLHVLYDTERTTVRLR